SKRRPAALVAYEVEWEDLDHQVHEVEPPLAVAHVDVPATDELELFAALGDVITGDAPWRPVLSPALPLSGREGASLTRYQVVLIGPSLTTDTLPVWDDPRFASLHGAWGEVRFERSVDLFLEGMLRTLRVVYALGQ